MSDPVTQLSALAILAAMATVIGRFLAAMALRIEAKLAAFLDQQAKSLDRLTDLFERHADEDRRNFETIHRAVKKTVCKFDSTESD